MPREAIGMRINPEIVKAIDILAREQNRNRSNTIEWVLFEWFKEHREDIIVSTLIETRKLLDLMPGEDVSIKAKRDKTPEQPCKPAKKGKE